MAKWKFVLADRFGGVIGELPAKSRRVTFRLDGSHDASFAASGFDPLIEQIIEMGTDLIVQRGATVLFRGRFGVSNDEIEDAHDCTFNAVDYRGFLATCRFIHPSATLVFTSDEAADIAWQLIEDGQDDGIQLGSALGIIRGIDEGTSVVLDQTYEPGQYIGDAVEKLGRLAGGFEWEIIPDPANPAVLKFNTWAERRGTVRDEFIASRQEGTVVKFSRTADTSKFGTLVRQSGLDGVGAYIATSVDIATRPEGRIDRVFGDPSLTDLATVTAAAEGQLALAEGRPAALTGKLAADKWTPDALWIGDSNPVAMQSGRLDENEVRRVNEITVQITDDDEEQVFVTWDRPTLDEFPEEALAGRVTDLERR